MLKRLTELPQIQLWGLMLLAGLSNTLAFAPYHYTLVPWLSLTLLVLCIDGKTVKQAGAAGFCYGLGWFGAGISWVHVSIDTFGGLPLIASLAMMLLLVAYLAIYPALACALTLKYFTHPSQRVIGFALFWLIAEWLRSVMLSGFPWLSLGYSQFNAPISALAPVIGEVGITFIMTVVAVALANLIKRRQFKTGLAIVALVGIATFMAANQQWTRALGSHKTIVLVQGNIEQNMRWLPENDWPTLLKYLDLSRPHYADADLIVWPEAAIPMLESVALEHLSNLDRSVAQNNTALITGIIDYHRDTKAIFNSLITLGLRNPGDSQGQYRYGHNNRYNKHHLLPIGEFVPLEDFLRPLAPIFDLPMSSFTRGDARQTNLRANGMNVVPAICYEIIFPRQLRPNISEASDLILTVSNDAWFGDSVGPLQHMQIAQMRALEFGRPLIRATNNGVTAITDEHGRITGRLEQFETGVLKTEVKLVSGQTPYLTYGDTPLWLLCGIYLLFCWVRSRMVKIK